MELKAIQKEKEYLEARKLSQSTPQNENKKNLKLDSDKLKANED